MNTRRIVAVMVVSLLSSVGICRADVYAAPSLDSARQQALHWINLQGEVDAELRAAAEGLWHFEGTDPSVADRYAALLQTFYLMSPQVRELVDACALSQRVLSAQEFAALAETDANPLYLNNVRLFYARYLTLLMLYDEALALFQQIDVNQVYDPASCLFYRAVCQHALLLKDDGLATIDELLYSTEDVPVRYATIAELMKHDLEALEGRSLDEVSRQMSDVERRLALGRAGQQVQRIEDQIISTLDEIIEKLEQQQGGGGGAGGGGTPNSPASDSYIGGRQGTGDVDQRPIGTEDNWGNLPERAETEAKNLINTQFPAHYRRAVEEYLRRIGERPAAE